MRGRPRRLVGALGCQTGALGLSPDALDDRADYAQRTIGRRGADEATAPSLDVRLPRARHAGKRGNVSITRAIGVGLDHRIALERAQANRPFKGKRDLRGI